ncbi:MAG: zinc ribbon domain-containing protein [Candidatus Lokiarchaeota archaeon]|nr:zinc ribbon domain-containing protein [Candidatus Lokiarchaeota archaeon]
MDISKFNKELGYRVAKAQGLEKNKKIEEAIKEWLGISDLVLNVTKTPNLNFSYKSMLIEKMTQIMDHIKMLKAQIYVPKTEPIKLEEEIEEEDEELLTLTPDEKEKYLLDPNLGATKPKTEKPKVVDDSEFNNIPKGFKEIEAPKDFKIITPHDEDFIKNILKMDVDTSHFKKEEQEVTPQELNTSVTPFEPSKDVTSEFCFACGTEVSLNQEKCPSCGTKLQ